MNDPQVPHIHLNGTSRTDLVDEYLTARASIVDAIEYLKRTAPNGRDYYPLGPGAMERASKEHWDRMQRLQSVANELERIIELLEIP